MNFPKYAKTNIIPTIFLYDEPSSKTLDLLEIEEYLKNVLGNVEIEIRGDFISHHAKNMKELAKKLAKVKVRDMNNPNIILEPLYREIRFEETLLNEPGKRLIGVLYDGFKLDMLLRKLMVKKERDFKYLHIAFTNRLFGTFDENERRYHARVIICGYPSIISTTGIVEALAKPREFYHLKQKYTLFSKNVSIEIDHLKEDFKGKFIDYDDEQLTEAMKGYVMQAIFYHMTFEPFCSDKKCRLYNAHWQEELINAQLKGKEFCERHKKILRKFTTQIL